MVKLEGSCHCGAVRWTFEGEIQSATACNCTICRRYGALWAYGYSGIQIETSGSTSNYVRGKAAEYHFCKNCACVTHYFAKNRDEQNRQKAVVNLRMCSEPEKIQGILIDHFDGLDKFDDLPSDGRCIKDLWF